MQITQALATMSSSEIADLVESHHDDVKRSMERLAARGVITLPPLAEVSNPRSGPRTISVYLVGKRDSYVVVAQMSPEFTARLVDRWQELEAQTALAIPNFADPVAAARAWADAKEVEQAAVAALALAAPKVEFVDRYVLADGAKGFREVAKLLKVNEAEFSQFLQDNKVMYRLAGRMTPYQCHIDAGRFVVRAGVSTHNAHAFTTVKFTPKGIQWTAGELAKHKLALESSAA